MEYLSNKKAIDSAIRKYIRTKHGILFNSPKQAAKFISITYKPLQGLDLNGVNAWFARKYLKMAVAYCPREKIKKLSSDDFNEYLQVSSITQAEDNFGWKKFFLTKEEYIKARDEFYKSLEWRTLRYEVLKEQRGYCCVCGRDARHGAVLHVDHIIPLSRDWTLRLEKSNLQVMCEDCNIGKLNKDSIDWRP